MVYPISLVLALSVSAIQFGYEVGTDAPQATTQQPAATSDLPVAVTTTVPAVVTTTNAPITTAAAPKPTPTDYRKPNPKQVIHTPQAAPANAPNNQDLPKVSPQSNPAPVPQDFSQSSPQPVQQGQKQQAQNMPVSQNYNPQSPQTQNSPVAANTYQQPSNQDLPQVTLLSAIKPKCNHGYGTAPYMMQSSDLPIAAATEAYAAQATDSPAAGYSADIPTVTTIKYKCAPKTTDAPVIATPAGYYVQTTDAPVIATPTGAEQIVSAIDPDDPNFNGVRIYNNVTSFSPATVQVTIVSNILPPVSNASHYTFDVNGKLSTIQGDEIYAQIVSPIPIFASKANWYPFDTYDALVVASCKEAQIAFVLNAAVDAWRTEFNLLDEGEQFMYLQITMTRTFVTILFSIFVNFMMWILSLSAIYLSVTSCTRKRKIEPPMYVWLM
ncbi:hypothetical protein HDV01_001272 [Terramyces sp. JEL0728]|nr:hypothetical protein HDV01_001272 [Terramyces sp. JEL0728]